MPSLGRIFSQLQGIVLGGDTMFRSSAARWALGTLAFIVALGVLRYKPWQRPDIRENATPQARETLAVGFLPVT